MYGDCLQVMAPAGGGGAAAGNGSVLPESPEDYFASSVLNPSGGFGFMAPAAPATSFMPFSSVVPKEEEVMCLLRDEEDSGGGSGGDEREDKQPGSSTEEPETQPPAAKKKRYHRHTAHQIQQMEALFKECPHPDDKQRMRLSEELGLKPRQVKFWFQNRRTQMKAQQDRADNVVLRAENDALRTENYRLQATIRNAACPNCGRAATFTEMSVEETHLRIENAQLKDELERLTCMASRFLGCPAPPAMMPALAPPPLLVPPVDLDMRIYQRHFSEQPPLIAGGIPPALDVVVMEHEKPLVMELAAAAVDHLTQLCRAGGALWVQRRGAGQSTCELLDAGEYAKAASLRWPLDGGKEALRRTEATRDSGVVIMSSMALADAFMDANKWMELFPSMVTKARALQVITVPAAANRPVILMQAELQFTSPLVPVREVLFFRHCFSNPDDGSWMIVDFPVDGFEDRLPPAAPGATRCHRRPSGCIIHDLPSGYSRVVWVEHVEVPEEETPAHAVFRELVAGGAAFGATRWVSLLQRQCERLVSVLARNISDVGGITAPEARKSMMKLSHRMIWTFCRDICSTGAPSWTAVTESPDDPMRVATRRSTEGHGMPNGFVLAAVTTEWLPVGHQQVFELITDEHRRSEITGLLSYGSYNGELAHIANGSHPRNAVSLLRMNVTSSSSQGVELVLLESSTHPTGGSLVVSAGVAVDSIQMVMSGEDPSFIPLKPIGFSAVPSSSAASGNGCLLTVAIQVPASTAKVSVSAVAAISASISSLVRYVASELGCEKPEGA